LSLVVLVVCALAVTGCVSMPSSGLVGEYSVTQGSGGSGEQYLQVNVESPGTGWSPVQIVQGFLAANASFTDNLQVAREYLTSKDAASWQDGWSATVFSGSGGPEVQQVSKSAHTAQVTVSGAVEATVGQSGAYIVPQTEHASQKTFTIDLTKDGGQWRITNAPTTLLLSEVDFAADYQSRDLYFFSPDMTSLVADPVYVPVEAARTGSDILLTDLVTDLIQQPTDWLASGATKTAFPSNAKVESVSLAGGTATVNLGGRFKASQQDLQEMAAQLLWTLGGSNDQPVVSGVQLEINGKPWVPGNSGISVLQQSSFSQYAPRQGNWSGTFYYLDSHGDVMRKQGPNGTASRVYTANTRRPVRFTSIAVSPDQRYLAAIADGGVYTGTVGGSLVERFQGSYTSVSWDSNDQLWMAEGAAGVEMTRGTSGSWTPVIMEDSALPVTALQVAPDGVRVALVLGKTQLTFGAISVTGGGIVISQSPFSVTGAEITALTWYGANNVIALSGTGAGSVATEYPVNGGASTTIQSYAGMANITASWSYPIISNPASGDMSYNESINGAWISLGVTGKSATYPG
jgi:hypothetical protein